MSEPTLIAKRPPIDHIEYIGEGGNPFMMKVGHHGVTQIRETEENGEFCTIPWVEVWAAEELVARFCQHKLERIVYRRKEQS